MIGYEPGYVGGFTREQAPGAMPNGTRVRKVWGEEEGGQPNGSEGAVLGSVHAPDIGYGYFVEWDAAPRHAVFCVASKLEPVE